MNKDYRVEKEQDILSASDGAGVGKGRTVACIIFENYLLGRKRAIWLSVSSDLKFDSERDLRDIGAGNIKARSGCKQVWGQFWACHQRFFKYLCIGAKVDACVQMAREAIKTNKCVVIGLQSTGEARTLETLEEMGGELTEFVSTSKAVLQGLIEKHFPSERGSTDIFRDFDKMFDDFDRPRKRKLPRNPMGFDVLDELGLGLGHSKGSPNSIIGLPGPSAKRLRRSSSSDQNSTTSSSGDEDDGTDSGLNDEDDIECSDEDVNIGDNDEDWLKALLAEAASSSESDDDDDDDDDYGKDDDSEPNEGVNATDEQRSNGEDEFNPFACDFSQDDPWASKQQVIEESPKKKIRV
uniref:AAA_34 domain-containing protein n=1 Tax=Heterorhabditis bacteriophora TaxID=37862 RepID=A0A1I7XB18_HETBA